MTTHSTHFEPSPSLLDASDDRALSVLAAYYHPLSAEAADTRAGSSTHSI